MAEQQTPTFKLVLVGDGGTGKVRSKDDCIGVFFLSLASWLRTQGGGYGYLPRLTRSIACHLDDEMMVLLTASLP